MLRDRQFLSVHPEGQGRAVEVLGDLSRARNIAVLVPGMGNNLETLRGQVDRADLIRHEAGPGTAAVLWLDYDSPQGLHNAISKQAAIQAGPALRRFTAGLDTERLPEAKVTLVGHSYGTDVVGQGLLQGVRADRVVLTGSPGITKFVNQASDFVPEPTRLYVERAPGDYMSYSEWHGPDPATFPRRDPDGDQRRSSLGALAQPVLPPEQRVPPQHRPGRPRRPRPHHHHQHHPSPRNKARPRNLLGRPPEPRRLSSRQGVRRSRVPHQPPTPRQPPAWTAAGPRHVVRGLPGERRGGDDDSEAREVLAQRAAGGRDSRRTGPDAGHHPRPGPGQPRRPLRRPRPREHLLDHRRNRRAHRSTGSRSCHHRRRSRPRRPRLAHRDRPARRRPPPPSATRDGYTVAVHAWPTDWRVTFTGDTPYAVSDSAGGRAFGGAAEDAELVAFGVEHDDEAGAGARFSGGRAAIVAPGVSSHSTSSSRVVSGSRSRWRRFLTALGRVLLEQQRHRVGRDRPRRTDRRGSRRRRLAARTCTRSGQRVRIVGVERDGAHFGGHAEPARPSSPPPNSCWKNRQAPGRSASSSRREAGVEGEAGLGRHRGDLLRRPAVDVERHRVAAVPGGLVGALRSDVEADEQPAARREDAVELGERLASASDGRWTIGPPGDDAAELIVRQVQGGHRADLEVGAPG